MAWWLSWLERRPVTAEVEGSNPSQVVLKEVLLVKLKLRLWLAFANLEERPRFGLERHFIRSRLETFSRRGGTGRRAGLKILWW